MALDKNKILSELNSVMSQLQDADCGCMSKLFSPDGQAPPVRPCCRGGCCRRMSHFNPQSGDGNPSCMGACSGACNPVQMYSDTYNFLNKNLMQPTVQEVMADFQGMNAANTVGAIGGNAGDPGSMAAGQMGMANPGNIVAGNMGMPNMNTGQMGMSNTEKRSGRNMGMPMDGGQTGMAAGKMGVGDVVMNDRGQIIEAQGQGMRPTSEGMGNMNQGMGAMNSGMSGMNQGMGGMNQEMGAMNPGMGGMNQGMGGVSQGMGGMNPGMGGMNQDRSGTDHLMAGMGQGIGAMGTGMGEQIINMMNMSGKNNMKQKGLMPNQGGMMPNHEGMMSNQGEMMQNQGGMATYGGGMGMNQENMSMANKGGVAIPFEGGTPVAYQPGMAMPNQGHMLMNQQGGITSGQGITNERGVFIPNQREMSFYPGDAAMPNQAGMTMPTQAGMTTPVQRGMMMSNRRSMPNQGVMGNISQGGVTAPSMAQSNVSVPPGQGRIANPNIPPNLQGNLAAGESPCIANPHRMCQHNVCRHGLPKGIKFNQLNPGTVSAPDGGDLDFDPMAIAMQMNPANQRLSAINMMNNLMSSNRGFNNYMNNFMGNKPTAQTPQQQVQYPPPQPQQIQQQHQQPPPVGTGSDQNQPSQSGVITSSDMSGHNVNQDSQSIQNVSPPEVPQNYQIAASQDPISPPAEQIYGTGKLSSITKTQAPVITEPIYAVHSSHPSRRLRPSPPSGYEMNALGQAVRSTPSGRQQPAAQFPRQLQSLPMPSDDLQRRSSDPMRQSYVKSTVSKTSIPRRSVTRIPSRGHMNVNRQSYSATGPNEKQANQGATRSDGRLYQPQYLNEPVRSLEQVSKVAGDATSGLPSSGYPPAVDAELIKGQQDELNNNGLPLHQTPPTAKNPIKGKCNGLQDRDFLAFHNLSYSFGGRPYTYSHSPARRR